ncbi:hypothetical protein ACFWIB_04350 [Streptomyces sp. NPDC127051]|uniref:hypothetical protein n=1 Tax=Streptomyces sp. NPDC127051 TaxID=3347119 RepID=UPI00364F3F41
MATQQDIARVALELEEAEATAEKLRRKRFISLGAGAAYSAAKGRIELATQELERLNAEWEAEQQALADRPDVEKAAAKAIAAAQKELEASRKAMAEATARAQQALVELGEAANSHNALIARHSAALAVRGLRLEDAHDHQTGGGMKGLRVRGAWWLPVEAPTLLVWVVHRAAAAVLPPRHRFTESLKYAYGRYQLDTRGDRPLAGVPALPARPAAPPALRPEVVDMRPPVYIHSVGELEEEIRRQLTGFTQAKTAPDGTQYMDRADAPDHIKQQVQHQLEQLHADVKAGRIRARNR